MRNLKVKIMKKDEYECAMCKKVFKKGLTDADAEKEFETTFPNTKKEDCELVCDDCYKTIMGWMKK
jgi:hypothetical protein